MNDQEQNIDEAQKILPAAKSNVVILPQEFGFRLLGNFMVLLVIFVLAFITLLVNTDMIAQKTTEISNDFYEYTSKIGLTLDDIVVTGREKTSLQEIMNVLNLKRGDNFLKINIYQIKKELEALPWVRNVVIRRLFFPNILQVSIEERKVRSIWQLNEKFYPIDYDGKVINASFKPTKPILLIVGEGAPENVNELLENISSNEALLRRVKVANFISGRRWNLVIDDIKEGMTIKLPENNVKNAWIKLLKLDQTKGILKRKLTFIDLRLKDKVVVKLKKNHADSVVKLRNAKEIKM